MFRLKTVTGSREANRSSMETKGEYRTLEDAIKAAVSAGLNLETSLIENAVAILPVREWIKFRSSGGTYWG